MRGNRRTARVKNSAYDDNVLLTAMKCWFMAPNEAEKSTLEGQRAFVNKFYGVYTVWDRATKGDTLKMRQLMDSGKILKGPHVDKIMFAFYGSGDTTLLTQLRERCEHSGPAMLSTFQTVLGAAVKTYNRRLEEFIKAGGPKSEVARIRGIISRATALLGDEAPATSTTKPKE